MAKRSLLATGMAILAAVVALPSPAHADAEHPHPPGACAGGKMSMYGSPTGHGFCDGTHYRDGSFWRAADFELPNPPPIQCVVNDPHGGLWPLPAPPGGCGGAVH
jgi:hypothetical protein